MPFMVAASVFSTVGVGLMTTFKPDTGHAAWIGYQAMVCTIDNLFEFKKWVLTFMGTRLA